VPAGTPSRRAVRARRPDRRRQLLDAAIWTFARKGYRAAGISDIITRAGVARGTFYLYFDSKADVFLAIIDDFRADLVAMLDEPERPVPLGKHHGGALLQRTIRRWLALFSDRRDAATVILREATSIDPRFEAAVASVRRLALDYFAERFGRAQTLGYVNPQIAPELLAHVQLGILDEIVNAFVLSDSPGDLDRLAEQLAACEWQGIRHSL
jgi:AcrR family transcriptional regulator